MTYFVRFDNRMVLIVKLNSLLVIQNGKRALKQNKLYQTLFWHNYYFWQILGTLKSVACLTKTDKIGHLSCRMMIVNSTLCWALFFKNDIQNCQQMIQQKNYYWMLFGVISISGKFSNPLKVWQACRNWLHTYAHCKRNSFWSLFFKYEI